MIYLDNASTTPVADEVVSEMMPYFGEKFGNPNSRHQMGVDAKQSIDQARRKVAAFIGANADQIIFTSGGTESNNMVFSGVANNNKDVLISSVEHDSVSKAAIKYFTKDRVQYIPVDMHGRVSPDVVADMLSANKNIGMVSVMYVNNEVGTVNDINAIGDICKSSNVLFHVDCVQAVGHIPLYVRDMNCDFLSVSAHKIYGPKGIGFLFVKNKKLLSPMICGGNTQEYGLRGGTSYVGGIVGLAQACVLKQKRYQSIRKETQYYVTSFIRSLEDACAKCTTKNMRFIINTPREDAFMSGILNISIPGVDAETLVLQVSIGEVYISAGSACHEGQMRVSKTLQAMGISGETAFSSIRISFPHAPGMSDNKYELSDEQIKEAAEMIINTACRLTCVSDVMYTK